MVLFAAAARYKMNITIEFSHYSELGEISKEQKGGEWYVLETKFVNSNFAKNCGSNTIKHEMFLRDIKTFKTAIASG